ncbi:MAG: hypothetical protein WCS37_02250 [Chloroflexota bacterium]
MNKPTVDQPHIGRMQYAPTPKWGLLNKPTVDQPHIGRMQYAPTPKF